MKNSAIASDRAHAAGREWQRLVDWHLPVSEPESIWRYSGPLDPLQASQGWKLHISATALSAAEMLRKSAEVLKGSSVLWKAAKSLDEVQRLNSGILYGYSQIGKILTVYAGSADVARGLAEELDHSLAGIEGPAVPFDKPFGPSGIVYYRYGVLQPTDYVEVNGVRSQALRDPSGALVPDVRAAGHAVPDWIEDTVGLNITTKVKRLPSCYLGYEAIAQRGKGGTYRALDLSVTPARRCVIKEGRRCGETDWDGRDGRSRVTHEAKVVKQLSAVGVNVPRVFASFLCNGNRYVVVEHLDGSDLQAYVAQYEGLLPVQRAIQISLEIAEQLQAIHSAGWAWRDCKAANLIVTGEGIRPIDFEGACRAARPDLSPWGSPGHVPPEWPSPIHAVEQDLYALGAVILFLLTSRLPDGKPWSPDESRSLPSTLVQLVRGLLDPRPDCRPSASVVASLLSSGRGF